MVKAAINWKWKTDIGGMGPLENTLLLSHLRAEAPGAAAQAQAIGRPLYYGADIRWFSAPKACYEALLDDLRRAQRRIWLAVPAIIPGVMWESVLDILRRKAARGVDVRLVLDGRKSRLSICYVNQFSLMRIRCLVLYRGKPFRAVMIDDGLLYAGDFRVSDDRIGLRSRLGECRAGMLRLRGSAASPVCARFLSLFPDIVTAPDVQPSLEYGYICWCSELPGTVQNLIRRAEHRVCLMAPRITRSVGDALRLAAASGVSVRAVVAHPSRRTLPGVELLRFPGRVQGLVCCADGRTAVVSAGDEGLWLHGRGADEIESDLRTIPGLTVSKAGHTPQECAGQYSSA